MAGERCGAAAFIKLHAFFYDSVMGWPGRNTKENKGGQNMGNVVE